MHSYVFSVEMSRDLRIVSTSVVEIFITQILFNILLYPPFITTLFTQYYAFILLNNLKA